MKKQKILKYQSYRADRIEKFMNKREQAEFQEKYDMHNLKNIAQAMSDLMQLEPDDQADIIKRLKKAKKK